MGRKEVRFHHPDIGVGVADLLEGQITYFSPKEGGAFIVADITVVILISHGGIRCWRFDERGQAALIIPVFAKGAGILFNTFAQTDVFTLEQILRQLAYKTVQTSIFGGGLITAITKNTCIDMLKKPIQSCTQ